MLNGPNLGRLGKREPDVYGATTYADLVALCEKTGRELGIEVEVRQTDHEGEMVGWLHEAADDGHPVVLNAGAWTHYSIAVRDACAAADRAAGRGAHLQRARREDFRQHRYISAVATGLIVGLGFQGYPLALRWVAENAKR